MSIFPTAAEMRAIFQPIVADAALQLGSRCDLYVEQSVKQSDATYVEIPALALANMPVRLTMISSELALSTFGQIPSIVMQGSMTRLTEIPEQARLNVVSGDFMGLWLEVVKIVEHPLSDSYTLGLSYSVPIA